MNKFQKIKTSVNFSNIEPIFEYDFGKKTLKKVGQRDVQFEINKNSTLTLGEMISKFGFEKTLSQYGKNGTYVDLTNIKDINDTWSDLNSVKDEKVAEQVESAPVVNENELNENIEQKTEEVING